MQMHHQNENDYYRMHSTMKGHFANLLETEVDVEAFMLDKVEKDEQNGYELFQ